VPKRDSLDKIVLGYFAAITTHPFTWGEHVVQPEPITFGPALLRGFTCPSGCGGCCPTFTLDYLPTEPHPYPLTRRDVTFDGRQVEVWSDEQPDNHGPRCHNLQPEDGRCGIHGRQPFSCDFELIRFIHAPTGWRVAEQLFGRGWAMNRTDGGTGALCTITDADVETALDVARRLDRLTDWADHFGLRRHRARVLASYCREYARHPDTAPRVNLRSAA